MQIKKHVPNFITLLNLSCGLLAVIAIFKGYYDEAFLFVCLGIFFDFFDGFFARKFNVSGDLGLQLDSLADMVTSGVVPGLMMFKLLLDIQEDDASPYFLTEEYYYMGFVPYLGFIITLASAYRLAKFNIDTRQTDSFIGLPTPANALVILSIPMIQYGSTHEDIVALFSNPYLLIGITLLSAYMLNAEIPLFSLKIKNFSWEKHKIQVIFLILCIILLFLLEFLALPFIILTYVVLSVLNKVVFSSKK
jgi:CDP-diacylglycerol--serine O-phosphatidyltransferase